MELKRGQIVIDKSVLKEHINAVRGYLKILDKVMTAPESNERGKRVAKIANGIKFTTDCIEHFGLGTPLNKLGKLL